MNYENVYWNLECATSPPQWSIAIGIVSGEEKVEITTFRKEWYLDETRFPNVRFTKSLYGDLSRRDFTINAIAYDIKNKKLIDYFNGFNDIQKRIIRCVGNENDRYSDDPLRMMRAIRFACQLGFELKTKMNHPEYLMRLSKERSQRRRY